MATFKTKGLDEYIAKLEALTDNTDEAIRKAVEAGAEILNEAIKEGLQSIPVHPDDEYGTAKNPTKGLTAKEKQEVIAAYGLAPIRDDSGYLNTKAGLVKVNSSTKTKKYPNGIPVTTLLRRVESGTSWIEKTPVIRQAVNRSKKAALEAMQKSLEESIAEEMKGV